MTNVLNVPFADLKHQDLDTALEFYGAPIAIDCVNWPGQFPYAPLCNARIARTENALLADFRVSGLDLRAFNLKDNGTQWEDSCVEIFIEDPDGSRYYNFEINPLGKILAASGPDRHNRTIRPEEEMADIVRIAQSLPDTAAGEPVDLKGLHSWRVAVAIPFHLVGADPKNLPHSLKANFYKCGDKTDHPHFLSWSPVMTPNPDFHRPEFFGELVLA